MYLPRSLISHLYLQLSKSHHALSPPVLILVALDPDSLCACRILTALLKRDYIPHKIKPISGYGDLSNAGRELVQPMRLSDGGSGGVVCCLGVGGLVDLESMLGLEVYEDGSGGADGVDVWIFDSRRPWNLANVFGSAPEPVSGIAAAPTGLEHGRITRSYKAGKGGIFVFDDGDIQAELDPEKEAWYALEDMPDFEDGDALSDGSQSENGDGPADQESPGRKRRRLPDGESEGEESDKENRRPSQRRRNNSVRTEYSQSQNVMLTAYTVLRYSVCSRESLEAKITGSTRAISIHTTV